MNTEQRRIVSVFKTDEHQGEGEFEWVVALNFPKESGEDDYWLSSFPLGAENRARMYAADIDSLLRKHYITPEEQADLKEAVIDVKRRLRALEDVVEAWNSNREMESVFSRIANEIDLPIAPTLHDCADRAIRMIKLGKSVKETLLKKRKANESGKSDNTPPELHKEKSAQT